MPNPYHLMSWNIRCINSFCDVGTCCSSMIFQFIPILSRTPVHRQCPSTAWGEIWFYFFHHSPKIKCFTSANSDCISTGVWSNMILLALLHFCSHVCRTTGKTELGKMLATAKPTFNINFEYVSFREMIPKSPVKCLCVSQVFPITGAWCTCSKLTCS